MAEDQDGEPPTSADPTSVLTPQKPQGARSHTARPQSHRFLKETLTKLSDDSIRIGRRLVAEDDGYRSPSPFRAQTPWTLPEQIDTMAEWEAAPDSANPFEVRNAMLAVSKVISAWEHDISKVAASWAEHIDLQVQRNSANNERWDELKQLVVTLQERLDTIDKRVSDRIVSASDFEAHQREANSQTRADLGIIVEAVGLNDWRRALAEETESLRQAVHGSGDSVKKCFEQFLFNGTDNRTSINGHVQVCLGKLDGLAEVARKDTEQWKVEAERWHGEKEEALAGKTSAEAKVAEAQKDIARLQASVTELSGKLRDTDGELQESRKAQGAAALSRVVAIENRGHLRMDRQTGHVDVLRGFEFAPCKTSAPPVADFKDAEAAAAVISDLQELWSLFDGPVNIDLSLKPGKGGKPEFWDKFAATQASALKDELEKAGLPSRMVMAKGSQVAKGAEPGIRIALLRDFFTDMQVLATDKKGKGKGSASPRGK